MSDLRKHLQAEKQAHQAERFPGDLGQLILPKRVLEYRKPERHSLWRIFGVALAAAAMIAIAIPVWHKLSEPVQQATLEQPQQEEEQMPIAMNETETMPDEAQDLPIMPSETGGFIPEYQSISFPTIPSFSDSPTTDENNQPTKESV